MNDLLRELAPVSAGAWREIEDEAKRTLRLMLAARKLVDFTGPLGWETSAVKHGRNTSLQSGEPGVELRLRTVQPLLEVRVQFELAREELEAVARGAKDANLDPVREAARKAAIVEDRAVFHGHAEAGIFGIAEAAKAHTLTLTDDYTAYPAVVAEAIHNLHSAGIAGPYGIALGPRCYTGLTKTTKGGFPVIEHVRKLVEGPIVWAPAVNGAAVLSQRGDDFELIVGQDFSIGYLDHSESAVWLYLQESFTFRVLSPEAAIPLAYPADTPRPTRA
ncbi:MAG TPA: family 1 encapsulin nanocompartment shell protein [Burkholderiales bacterium]|nr:family 1 encapsulin nanocompartment shell protein [Burkholderiales bacterium]